MKYRAEIDGLRAIAVISVILFHAGIKIFRGGFVGVDIFFVISGYLITSIIMEEMEDDRFSITNFYERRARRILPALFFVILCCIPFAWMWMLPSQLEDFAQSFIATSLFSSNMLFWSEGGYFSQSAEMKPLLHTWSLAVEEQYYLFFPVFLMLVWRFGRKRIFLLILIIAIASFLVSEWGWRNYPLANFYFAPTRMWELLIGSMCAFSHSKINQKRTENSIISIIGLMLILFSILYYNENTPFPSFYTLIPTIGTAIVIIFSINNTITSRILSFRPFIVIGLISYSTYLCHQPIFAFIRLTSIYNEYYGLILLSVIISFIIGYFIWKYIENPFRNKYLINNKKIVYLSLIIFSFNISIGYYIISIDGFVHQINNNQRYILSYINYPRGYYYREGRCFLEYEQNYNIFGEECKIRDRNSVLIWGDSHAAALSYGIRSVYPRASQLTASGCPPIIDRSIDKRIYCKQINNYILSFINSNKPKIIYVHADWFIYENIIDDMSATIKNIKKLSPISRVVIIGNVPHWHKDLPELMFRRNISADREFIYLPSDRMEKVFELDNILEKISHKYSVEFIRPAQFMCRNKECIATVLYNKNIQLSAWDESHLTTGGAVYLTRNMLR